MKKINRPLYPNKLIELIGTPDIKVVTGVKRCGKSEIIKDLIEYISHVDPLTNIIVISFQDLTFNSLKNFFHYTIIASSNIEKTEKIICS